jgi:hypothetical protein
MSRNSFSRPCLETLEDRLTPSAMPVMMPGPVLAPVAAATAPVTAANGLTANQQFIQSLYNDLLGRSGSISELNFWVNLLPSQGRTGVARSIVNSGETQGDLVDVIFGRMLGRVADPSGRAFWINFLRNGGTLEGVLAGFAGSAEFIVRQNILIGGSDPRVNFVEGLYAVLLNRAASFSEASFWVNVLGTQGATAVGRGIANSQEFRVAAVRTFYGDPTQVPFPSQPFFPNLLQRTTQPNPSEIFGWTSSSNDLITILVDIAGSQEYFNVRSR